MDTQELEAAVEDRITYYEESIARDNEYYIKESEKHAKTIIDYEQALINNHNLSERLRVAEDSEQSLIRSCEGLREEVQEKETLIVSLTRESSLLRDIRDEERRERLELQKLIFEFTGLKLRENSLVQEDKVTDDAIKTVNPSYRSRSRIKDELEARARKLLKEQREREDKAITKGDLKDVH